MWSQERQTCLPFGRSNAQTRTCADSVQSESAGEERVGDLLLFLVEDSVRPDEG